MYAALGHCCHLLRTGHEASPKEHLVVMVASVAYQYASWVLLARGGGCTALLQSFARSQGRLWLFIYPARKLYAGTSY